MVQSLQQDFHKFSHNYWHSMVEMIWECLSLTLDEPTIGPHDTGQRIPCFDRCPLTITWMSNIKEGDYKSSQPTSWSLAAMLRRQVDAVVRAYAPTSNTASHGRKSIS